MALGPIELVVIGFPETPSSGRIANAIQDLVDAGTITLVDALLLVKEQNGEVMTLEVEQVDASDDIKALAALLNDEDDGLLSDEDAFEIAESLEPGESALMLVFENTWVRPVRAAVLDAGGVVMAHVRVPGAVVDEVVAALAAGGEE